MCYDIVKMHSKIITGIGIETTNENMKSIGDISEVWKKFFCEGVFSNIKNKMDNKVIGVYTDYKSDYTKPYKFYACSEVIKNSRENDNFSTIIIPEDNYAKFSIIGNRDKTVLWLWQEIWKTELDRKYTYDFELYYDTENIEKQLIEIYIAIR